MLYKSSKMIPYGIQTQPVNSRERTKNDDYTRHPDKRIFNFCIDCCPHDRCTGNRCKELIDYEKTLIKEE